MTLAAVARGGTAAVALGAVSALGGCGGSHSNSPANTSAYHPLQPPTASTASTRPGTRSPQVGAAQRVRAGVTTLTVTVERILDPLDGSGAALLPHTRALGVIAAIHNDGPGVYDSSSTGDFAIVPSSGTATPVFAPAGVCQTPLRDWDNQISPGEERSGCVAFALSANAKVSEVRFSPHARAADRVTWAVPR
jgi:hypothetical protein